MQARVAGQTIEVESLGVLDVEGANYDLVHAGEHTWTFRGPRGSLKFAHHYTDNETWAMEYRPGSWVKFTDNDLMVV